MYIGYVSLLLSLMWPPIIVHCIHTCICQCTFLCRKYYTPCKGSVVQSPLRLDSNTVYFAGTPVYSSAVATVTLMCDKTKHKGPKVTSRAFRFCLPDNSPVSVSPLAGIIAEGKVCVMTKLNILHWIYVITYWNVHMFICTYIHFSVFILHVYVLHISESVDCTGSLYVCKYSHTYVGLNLDTFHNSWFDFTIHRNKKFKFSFNQNWTNWLYQQKRTI